ncbi:MAG: aspartate kinase [Armatimonadetes bacterium]|nr:aspartate kinase [Armatimonadota bacterium]
MKLLVQKFGGTSVAEEDARQKAASKVIRAVQAGWRVVVVVSAIGRRGAPYATDTLIDLLRGIDKSVAPAERELDLVMACGELISTAVFAHTLRTRGHHAVAMTGGQAGIRTDNEHGNARIRSIDPAALLELAADGTIAVVAGFQGITDTGAITTLGRGGSDTTASAIGAALAPHVDEIAVEIYTDVNGVKTADPRMVDEAKTLRVASYREVAEMAHQGAKVVHPRAAEIAHIHNVPLWVKSTFDDAPGTLITGQTQAGQETGMRVTGVTHTGKIVYLRFTLPAEFVADKQRIERQIYRMLQGEEIPLYLNVTSATGFAFAITKDHLPRVRVLLDGLMIPVEPELNRQGRQNEVFADAKNAEREEENAPKTSSPVGRNFVSPDLASPASWRFNPPMGRVYLLGLGSWAGFQAQKKILEATPLFELHTLEAEMTENCTVVSVIASQFQALPGVMARLLAALARTGVPVYQTADSAHSISALIPEADAPSAVRALHHEFGLSEGG